LFRFDRYEETSLFSVECIKVRAKFFSVWNEFGFGRCFESGFGRCFESGFGRCFVCSERI
jgi:hypothetical protein